jgi:hypothetical protein
MSTFADRHRESGYSIAQRLVENRRIVFAAETLELVGAITTAWLFDLSLVSLVASVAVSSLLIALAVAFFAPSPEER